MLVLILPLDKELYVLFFKGELVTLLLVPALPLLSDQAMAPLFISFGYYLIDGSWASLPINILPSVDAGAGVKFLALLLEQLQKRLFRNDFIKIIM